jgi:ribonuclease HI
MELMAAIQALSQLTCLSDLDIKVTLYTDSQYLNRGMNEWVKGWRKRDWKLVNGQPMKNADLWKRLDDLNSINGLNIQWKWVRGHDGNKYNEMADHLAQEASQ